MHTIQKDKQAGKRQLGNYVLHELGFNKLCNHALVSLALR